MGAVFSGAPGGGIEIAPVAV
eukprot:COSAG06_NODE_12130_length_1420_cov_1.040878_1_plen_20_part_10